MDTSKITSEIVIKHSNYKKDNNRITLTDELYADLAIDSRKFISIIRDIEDTFGKEIDDESILNVDIITFGDLLKFVEDYYDHRAN